MVEVRNIDSQTQEWNELLKLIPKDFQKALVEFLKARKYGTVSFIIQNGEIVGCDIIKKERLTDR